jgi:hypothetical protein
VPNADVLPENFETLAALARLVARLRTGQRRGAPEETPDGVLLDAVRLLETAGVRRQQVALGAGEQMHVLRVAGAQPTWVLLPGLGNPSTSFGLMLRSLANENGAIAVDFAGFGLSTCRRERPVFADHVRLTIDLLRAVARPPFVLVGNSPGPWSPQKSAGRSPTGSRPWWSPASA